MTNKVTREQAADDISGYAEDSDLDDEDKSDLLKLAELVRKADDRGARAWAARLDTIVRDEIPESAYGFCGLRSIH